MTSLVPVKIPESDKLRVLRRLDQFRIWESLDDDRQCIQCGKIFSGHEIEVVGGTRGLGPLRVQCPTKNCPALAIDWILPNTPAKPAKVEIRQSMSVAPMSGAAVTTSNRLTGSFLGLAFAGWGI